MKNPTLKDVMNLHHEGFTARTIGKRLGINTEQVESMIQRGIARRRNFYIFVIALAVSVAVVWFVRESHVPDQQPNTLVPQAKLRAFGHLQMELDKVYANLSNDEWILIDDSSLNIHFMADMSKKLNEALNVYSDIPEVRVLQAQYQNKFFPTVYYQGVSRAVSMGSDFGSETGKIEVCFFPASAMRDPHLHGQSLFYRADWRALMVPGIKYDHVWFSAFSLHELEHARLRSMDAPSSTAPEQSGLWIEEENGAHLIERQVLDAGTQGRYVHVLNNIALKYKNVGDLKTLYNSVTASDIAELNDLFSPAGNKQMSYRLTQYLLDIGESWLESRFTGDELKRQRVNNYRTLLESDS